MVHGGPGSSPGGSRLDALAQAAPEQPDLLQLRSARMRRQRCRRTGLWARLPIVWKMRCRSSSPTGSFGVSSDQALQFLSPRAYACLNLSQDARGQALDAAGARRELRRIMTYANEKLGGTATSPASWPRSRHATPSGS